MTFKKGHKIFLGRKHSIETRRKISLANKGRVFSKEWRENLSKAHKGQVSWCKGKIFVSKDEQKKRRKKYIKLWRLKNKNHILKVSRIWAKKNRKKRAIQAKLRYQKNPQKELDRVRYKKYGITGDEFRNLIKKQGMKCPICNRSIKKNLSVDHDHKTGKIRGIICNDCNLAIGNAESSIERLKSMVNYLEKQNVSA